MCSSSNAEGSESRDEDVVSILSKAAERSRSTRAETFCLLQARRMSLVMRSSAVSQEWNLR